MQLISGQSLEGDEQGVMRLSGQEQGRGRRTDKGTGERRTRTSTVKEQDRSHCHLWARLTWIVSCLARMAPMVSHRLVRRQQAAHSADWSRPDFFAHLR